MAEIINIDDHMARACDCGGVRFNLLKSGFVECDNCQEKQTNIEWVINVDLNKSINIPVDVDFSEETIEKGRAVILSAIEKNQSCFWGDIVRENSENLPQEAILQASKIMQRNKEIRLREDDLEHAMEYLLVRIVSHS